ncbi:MAG: 3-dehydroquinate dehydratase [Bacteroidales bacterium]|nr:3-dehydroquinate dehydratase [Bacteroidales bacterium]
MRVAIINGPNLNLLGSREKDIYGGESFEDYLEKLGVWFPDIRFSYFQSNIEGELVNYLHKAASECDGVIMNAGGYTHTSVAIGDAVKAIDVPVVEVHISNILAREDYRHISLIAPACRGSLFGFGLAGYRLAAEYFSNSKDSN